MNTPALDFCQRVRTWQDADGAASGLPMLIPGSSLSDLDTLLTGARVSGPSPLLEDRARRWLIGYRELESQQRVLTSEQRAELDGVIAGFAMHPAKIPVDRNRTRTRQRIIVAAVTGALALAAGIGTRAALSGNGEQGSPPPAGISQPHQRQIPAGATDLQRFRADWNAPAAATADAGNPARLVLLQDGLYYPVPWGIPAGDAGWVPDTTGTISGTPQIHGGQADVTDSDGTTWTVAVGQPFVLASSPQAVFRVLRDAAIQTIPQPHAIAVRKHL
jgi:hypothetical protein